MITVKCVTPHTLKLSELTPFQGELKKRSVKEINDLADSISNEGLLMPFAVWRNDSKNYLLDGHGRLAALTELLLKDASITQQDLPCIFIEAESEEEAKKALLQITSQYGKITRDGVAKFCATIPEYKAPSINKFKKNPTARHKTEVPSNLTVIRIAVPTDKVEEIKNIFKDVSYIKVM